jgi:hypothetical protein
MASRVVYERQGVQVISAPKSGCAFWGCQPGVNDPSASRQFIEAGRELGVSEDAAMFDEKLSGSRRPFKQKDADPIKSGRTLLSSRICRDRARRALREIRKG